MEVESMEVLTSRTIIHPRDLDRSLAFYGEGLDLPVAREFGHGAGRGVVFFAGGGLIEVVGTGPRPGLAPAPDLAGTADHPPAIALWLQVRSMVTAITDLRGRGVPVVRPPVLEPWGLVEAWIEDPDGLRIHLVEVPTDHPLRRDARVIER
jgi:catechol 2,3-dioxygenase-like lactoylglutathione lyase family enzyme